MEANQYNPKVNMRKLHCTSVKENRSENETGTKKVSWGKWRRWEHPRVAPEPIEVKTVLVNGQEVTLRKYPMVEQPVNQYIDNFHIGKEHEPQFDQRTARRSEAEWDKVKV